MPRACVPDTRFLAHADSPLLPLLAPRFFADAPSPGNPAPFHRNTTTKQEVKTNGNRKLKKFGGDHVCCANEATSRHRKGLSSSRAQDALLYNVVRRTSLKNNLDLRYVEISAFARQHLRYFSTQESLPKNEAAHHILPKVYENARRKRVRQLRAKDTEGISSGAAEHKRSVPINADSTARRRHVPRKTTSKYRIGIQQKLGAFSTNDVTRSDGPARYFYELRRRRELRETVKRLKIYHTHSRGNRELALRCDGRYRTLRRRYINLRRKEINHLSLKIQEGRLDSIFGRLEAFAFLDRLTYPKFKRKTIEVSLEHDEQCPSWVSMLFKNARLEDISRISENWTSIEQHTRAKIWPYLLFYLLHVSPLRALQFIRVLTQQTEVDDTKLDMIADALEHICAIYVRKRMIPSRKDQHVEDTSHIVPTFFYFFRDHCVSEPHVFSQHIFYNISVLADIEDLKRVFDLIEKRNVFLFFDTLLQFAEAFTKAGEYQYTLRCFEAIQRRTNNTQQTLEIFGLKRFRYICALLLRRSNAKGHNYHSMPALVATLVKLGVKIDTLLYNVIMQNAMEAGDYSTAFEVYNSLSDHGLTPDKYTFSTLLHGCTTSAEPAKFHDFAVYCLQQAKELRDPRLAADYLYYHYAYSCKEVDKLQEHDFDHLLHVYTQLFFMRPLELLFRSGSRSSAIAEDKNDPRAVFTPLNPPPIALYIILQARIQVDSEINYDRIWHLFLRFQQLVREKADSHINALASQTVIWNAFLLAFCKHKQFRHASHVIEAMREHNPQPDHYTWTIMMQAFFKANQPAAAERVYAYMRHHGVEPSQFTYGTMLIAYARKQRIEDVGQVMDLLDDEQLDPDVLRALSKVYDREKLVLELRMSKERKEEKKKLEQEQRTQKRVSLWRSLLESQSMQVLNGLEFKSMLPPVKERANGEPNASSSEAAGDI